MPFFTPRDLNERFVKRLRAIANGFLQDAKALQKARRKGVTRNQGVALRSVMVEKNLLLLESLQAECHRKTTLAVANMLKDREQEKAAKREKYREGKSPDAPAVQDSPKKSAKKRQSNNSTQK